MIEHPFIAVVALLLIVEGITPFLAPKVWRQMLQQISQMKDSHLRIMGAIMMVAGAIIFNIIQS